jgi:ABC-type antimicrobial peptide transport system permease subunit
VAAGSGSGSGTAAGSGSGSAVAAGSGSGSGTAAGSGSGTAVAAGSGSASGSGSGSAVGSGSAAGSGSGSAVAAATAKKKRRTKPHSLTSNPCEHPDLYYCDERDRTCHHRVPVLISQTIVELYNSQFAPAHNLPEIGELETFIANRGGFGAMSFEIHLGDTLVAGSNAQIEPEKKHTVQAVVVGISSKAMMTGMTMPIGYMRRWVQEYVSEEASKQYSKIIVTLSNKDRLAVFNQWIMDQGLRTEDSVGERFATAIFVVEILFFVISFAIIVISAINIAHNLFMQVTERRREIGVLRAVGATRTDVKLIILGEAAVVGVVGGLIGIAGAEILAHVADWALTNYLPRFPFKPDTYFDFKLWILAGGMAFSTVFCVLGGYLPARKASLIEPAQALAAQ